MIAWTDELRAQFRVLRVIGVTLFITTPLVYLIIAGVLLKSHVSTTEISIELVYLLLGISVFLPMVGGFLEKSTIREFRKKTPEMSNPAKFSSISIMKMALVEAIFVGGMAVYFLTGELQLMLYFYPIGAIWAWVVFPRENHYESFEERLQTHVPVD